VQSEDFIVGNVMCSQEPLPSRVFNALSWFQAEAKPEAAAAPPVAGANNWEATTFRGDQEGKMTAKFKRLMGIKEAGMFACVAFDFTAKHSWPRHLGPRLLTK
jgi:hypothetical protein